MFQNYCMIPTALHSGKKQNYGDKKINGCWELGGGVPVVAQQ